MLTSASSPPAIRPPLLYPLYKHIPAIFLCLPHPSRPVALTLLGLLLPAALLSLHYLRLPSLLFSLLSSIDLPMAAALATGAAASCAVNGALQWLTRGSPSWAGESSSYGATGGGVMGAALPDELAEGGAQEIPDGACYYCVRRAATSKCGSCRLVYYCCRMCQMQAWRKHRHVCGAAAAAAARIHRSRSLVTPSQWRALSEYTAFVKSILHPSQLVPTCPAHVAAVLLKIRDYVCQRPEIVCQEMADSVWAAALSLRSEGAPERLHMAWAWGFLEASVESGSADAFLAALRITNEGPEDLPRVNRWMKRGLCQALLMLNKRQEVGEFFRVAPRQQLLYY